MQFSTVSKGPGSDCKLSERISFFGNHDNHVNSKVKCHQSHLSYHFMTDLSGTHHTVSVVISPRASCFLSITGSHFASLTLTLALTLCISSTPGEQFRYLVACPGINQSLMFWQTQCCQVDRLKSEEPSRYACFSILRKALVFVVTEPCVFVVYACVVIGIGMVGQCIMYAFF